MENNGTPQNATDVEKDKNEGDEEPAVTMLDVLQDEQDLEDDANAVLGAADDQNCTYDQGYIKRQAVYACTSCSVPASPDFKPAGLCLACSYHCHEGHDLVELYTKRNFRCDCGTPRSTSTCKLRGGKTETENKYNQNYSGVYCSCSRPYPDPEDPTPDEMIQCVVCEDWYHGRHLGLPSGPPKDNSYAEMICVGCVTKHPLLSHHSELGVPQVEIEEADCPVEEVSTASDGPLNGDEDAGGTVVPGGSVCSNVECKLMKTTAAATPRTLFLPDEWRTNLCRCNSCLSSYEEAKISFLLDLTDTVHHYESQGKKRKCQYDEGMEALSQLDRVQQVEAISMYTSMKTELMDYLATFAREGRVVKEEDIKSFFAGIKSSKRRKLDLPPPDTCK